MLDRRRAIKDTTPIKDMRPMRLILFGSAAAEATNREYNWLGRSALRSTQAYSAIGGKLKTALVIDFVWIPFDLGGHNAAPWTGMRLQIRWQQFLEAYLERARDVQCELLRYEEATMRGKAHCVFASADPVPAEWLEEGQLVELLNGFRVLAVGRVAQRDGIGPNAIL